MPLPPGSLLSVLSVDTPGLTPRPLLSPQSFRPCGARGAEHTRTTVEASLSRPGSASPDPAFLDARSHPPRGPSRDTVRRRGIAFSFHPHCPGAQTFPQPVPCCGDGPSCWAAVRSDSRLGHGGATGCSAWSAPSQSSAHTWSWTSCRHKATFQV